MVTFAQVREMALALPEVTQGPSWGTTSFKVRNKLFVRQHEDGESVVVKVAPDEREALVAERPDTFVVTPHYEPYPLMLVRMARIDMDEMHEIVVEAWRMVAPKRLAAAYDRGEHR